MAIHGSKLASSVGLCEGGLDIDRCAVKVGETLVGRYELRQSLGSGRCTLFIAHDRRADRLVAVKVFDAARAASDDLRRYATRLTAATTVSHPAVVVPQVQIAVSESPPFVVGELLQGEDLGSLCARLKAVPWERALTIARTCAEGLAALAAATGAAHRALRPGNVWIAATGQVQILDFGIAELGAPPVHPRPDGTFVEYRAPEQLEGAPGDARSDVFSLGVLLCEMVTGVHPFSGSSAAAVTIKLLTQPAPTLSQLAPHLQLPAPLAELIRRALARRPKDRFADAAAMVGELAALLPAAPPVETPAPAPPQPEAPARQAERQSARTIAPAAGLVHRHSVVAGSENQSPAAERVVVRSGPERDADPLADRTMAMPRGGRSGQVEAERTEVLPRSDRANRELVVEHTELLPRAERPRPVPSGERTEVLPQSDDEARTQTLRRLDRPSKTVDDDAHTQTLPRFGRPSRPPTVDEERTQTMTRLDGRAPRPGDETLTLPDRRPASESTEVLPRGRAAPAVDATMLLPDRRQTSESTKSDSHVSGQEHPAQIQVTHASAIVPQKKKGQQGHDVVTPKAASSLDDATINARRFLIALNLVLAALLLVGWLWLRG